MEAMPGGVMGVQMDGNFHRGLQPTDQTGRPRVGASKPAMSLTHRVSVPRSSNCLAMLDEPFNAVHGADGIADRRLDMFAAGFDLADGAIKVADVVQGIENAEDVDAVGWRTVR